MEYGFIQIIQVKLKQSENYCPSYCDIQKK